ncbi:helix-turn-helix transcriptional regulator [Rhizobium laguerreae]|uniref:helix-turn-helix transcriptional regulator n=1 Tax=Rhizobium laguerreae TaxID=1076926 RepID=UPI001C8FC16F|nr:helix-turn-helix domain-containing protein [Rhizobium laguerreae]MBY3344786.1 DNA-binding protein [Rhizobium laguerreae]MBY3351819.1 DNA-binding protein [Rhizobium laguerreae]MBY3372493.1 DNA-binding protein [Rhizobium laguerreae]MBY3427660.1 DNA-binding protein [Rhizobium laguerreae]MBY3436670.1 DNA-binding protein [Rhizobium laguerreae]
MTSSQKYLTGPQVLARYQISEMTLHRWQKNRDLAFPQPMKINHRKFFLEDDLIAWERNRAAGRAV